MIAKISLYCILKLTKNSDPDKYSHSGYVFDLIHMKLFNCLMLVGLVKI